MKKVKWYFCDESDMVFDGFTDGERWYVHGVAKDASEVPFATAAG